MRRQRVTLVLSGSTVRRLRGLAEERGAALSRIGDEAMVEYLERRPPGSGVSLLAQTTRKSGRPSRLDLVERARQEDGLRKRTGRPLHPLAPEGGADAPAPAAEKLVYGPSLSTPEAREGRRRMTAVLADPDPLVRTWEVARLFNVDVTTVRRWTKHEGLPFIWLPTRQRRYRKSAVVSWYRQRTAGYADERPRAAHGRARVHAHG